MIGSPHLRESCFQCISLMLTQMWWMYRSIIKLQFHHGRALRNSKKKIQKWRQKRWIKWHHNHTLIIVSPWKFATKISRHLDGNQNGSTQKPKRSLLILTDKQGLIFTQPHQNGSTQKAIPRYDNKSS